MKKILILFILLMTLAGCGAKAVDYVEENIDTWTQNAIEKMFDEAVDAVAGN